MKKIHDVSNITVGIIAGIGLIITLLFIANISSFFFVELDQFNVFHRYQEVYSLEDWNLPHTVRIDMDDDGKKDIITFYGCIFISSVDSRKIPQSNICYDNQVEKGKTKGYQIPQSSKIFVNSYVGKKDNSWNIIVNDITDTKLYEITSKGDVIEKDPPLSLKIDSFLYTISHILPIIISRNII